MSDDVRQVRMTPELMSRMVEAAAGKGNRIEWGEADEEGFYTPSVTIGAADDQIDRLARALQAEGVTIDTGTRYPFSPGDALRSAYRDLAKRIGRRIS